jgi:hypothetical protein
MISLAILNHLKAQFTFAKLFHSDFIPVQDDTTQSPSSLELSNYEAYSRQELPRVFRAALEVAVNEQAQPIEDGLRSQLVNMIQECQTYVFSTYRSQHALNTSNSLEGQSTFNPATTAGSPSPSQAPVIDLSTSIDHDPFRMLQSFYQPPPTYQNNYQTALDFNIGEGSSFEAGQQGIASDSGYSSGGSALMNSTSRASEISTTGTHLDANCQHQQPMDFGAADSDVAQSFSSMIPDTSNPIYPPSAYGMNERAMFLSGVDVSQPDLDGNFPTFDWTTFLS